MYTHACTHRHACILQDTIKNRMHDKIMQRQGQRPAMETGKKNEGMCYCYNEL